MSIYSIVKQGQAKPFLICLAAAAMLAAFMLAGCELAERDNPYDPRSSSFVQAVYVSVAKGDDAFPGSQEKPKKTIQAGINRAKVLFPDTTSVVRVAQGTYIENSITMINGVSVLGGYSDSWIRNPDVNITAVTDNRTAGGTTDEPNNVFYCPNTITDTVNTTLDGFTINLGAGVSNAGIFCEGNPTISHNIIMGKNSSTSGITEAFGISIISASPIISDNTINPGWSDNTGSYSTYGIYIDGNALNTAPQVDHNIIKGGYGKKTYGINCLNYSNPIISYNEEIGCGAGSTFAKCININSNCHPDIMQNIFKNDAGITTLIYEICEMSTTSNPIKVRNNTLFPRSNNEILYYDNGSTNINDLVTAITTNEGTQTLTFWNNGL